MKIKERALSLLLSLVMVLTFMPALTFADDSWSASPKEEEVTLSGGTTESPGSAELEVVIDNGEYTGAYSFAWYKAGAEDEEDIALDGSASKYQATSEGSYYCIVKDAEDESEPRYVNFYVNPEPWSIVDHNEFVLLENDPVTLTVQINGSPYGITYQWHIWDPATETEVPIEGATSNTLTVTEENWYDCKVSKGEEVRWDEFNVRKEAPVYPEYYGVSVGGLWYELHSADNEAQGVDVYADGIGPSGHVDIPANITLSNGKSYPVKWVYFLGENVTSVSIPASVTYLDYIGLRSWDEDSWDSTAQKYGKYEIAPGFVIFGTNGTAAQVHANKYGIAFRDLAAEAEAARQGTPGNLPKVKASKPKAAKKAITVKWKKLNKKQLKSGVSNIEVWVCSDGAFANGSTIERVAGKKKSSLKIKGLQKGVTYYVKVRAITYSGGTKIVGPWSAVKKIKVKK